MMFDKELAFFIDNQAKLFQQYGGKTLVIVGTNVVDVYDTPLKAYLESKTKYEPGTYMIQQCAAGSDAYTVSISSANSIFE